MTITRNSERRKGARRALAVMAGLSLLAHLALLAMLGPTLLPNPDVVEVGNPSPPEEPLVVEATFEEEEPSEEEEPEPEMIQPELAEAVPDEVPEPPKEEEEQTEPIENTQIDRKIVEQQTNEEMPNVADYLSPEANRVKEETRARETTTEDLEPSRENTEEGGEPPPELATREHVEPKPRPEPRPQPEPEQREQAEAEPEEFEGRDPVILPERKAQPRRLLMPDMKNYEQMFAQRDEKARERAEENGQGEKLFENWEENDARVRASLENFIHEVKPGNHTGVNAHPSVLAGYIGAIHRKIHVRWANNYLMDLDLHEPPGSPLNDPKLNAKLEFVIRADDGEIEAVNIVRSSGQLRFDSQAVSVAYRVGPHPDPPPELVSPNGKVYVHWNFWRDQRQCGTFGAAVFIVNEDHQSPG